MHHWSLYVSGAVEMTYLYLYLYRPKHRWHETAMTVIRSWSSPERDRWTRNWRCPSRDPSAVEGERCRREAKIQRTVRRQWPTSWRPWPTHNTWIRIIRLYTTRSLTLSMLLKWVDLRGALASALNLWPSKRFHACCVCSPGALAAAGACPCYSSQLFLRHQPCYELRLRSPPSDWEYSELTIGIL